MPPDSSYLDYNATAPLRPEARSALLRALEVEGNASSLHGPGRAARALVEEAREAVADLVGARPLEVLFTSGATEANNLCLAGSGAVRRLASAGEHESVLAALEGQEIGLEPDGRIDLSALQQALTAGEGPALVSLMAANNETGVIQPLQEAASCIKSVGGYLHSDAVQAVGRLDPALWAEADYISLSAHKLGGPKGIGALVVRDAAPLRPLLRGGGQEQRLRAGTENVAAIAGFGAAARAVASRWRKEVAEATGLRDRFEAGLRDLAPDVVVFGAAVPRLANTSCFALPGLRAETLLIKLDLAGIFVSSGSACSSGKVQRSHVLTAMGVEPHLSEGALRVSFGWASSAEDVVLALKAFAAILRRDGPAVAQAVA
ncbi:MAG: cysteine desulfurase family protein [Rhodospirillales bacterium]